MNVLERKMLAYAAAHSTPPSAELQKIERETHLKTIAPQMLSGPIQGKFLEMWSRLVRPRRALEIGTFTGYGSLCIAAGLAADGLLHTIEANEEFVFLIKNAFAVSDFSEKIRLHVGDAAEIVPKLDDEFDLIFLDGGKLDYLKHYQICIEKLRDGGWLLADNVLWENKVADPEATDRATETMRAFNDFVQNDPRVENLLLPLRDGLLIVRKLEKLGN